MKDRRGDNNERKHGIDLGEKSIKVARRTAEIEKGGKQKQRIQGGGWAESTLRVSNQKGNERKRMSLQGSKVLQKELMKKKKGGESPHDPYKKKRLRSQMGWGHKRYRAHGRLGQGDTKRVPSVARGPGSGQEGF